MMLEEKLSARLSSIVSLYPLILPDDFVTPCARYVRTSTDPDIDLDGEVGSANIAIQIDVYADRLKDAKALAKTIRVSLDDWAEVSATRTDEADLVETVGERRLYRTMMRFSIHAAD